MHAGRTNAPFPLAHPAALFPSQFIEIVAFLMLTRPAAETGLLSFVLPLRRVPVPSFRMGFWARLASAAFGVCALSVCVLLMVAYLAGPATPQ